MPSGAPHDKLLFLKYHVENVNNGPNFNDLIRNIISEELCNSFEKGKIEHVTNLPSLNALRAFDAVARLNSVSAAAAELSVTPSAVSRQISNLEEDIGIALVTRDGRGVRLTDDGRRLEGGLGGVFDQIAAAVDRLRQPANIHSLRIVVPPMLASLWLIPRLDRFVQQYPEANVILMDSEEERNIATRADCAITWGRFEDSATTVAERLSHFEQIFPVCRPNSSGTSGLTGMTLLELETTTYAAKWMDWPAFATAAGLDLSDTVTGPRLTAGPLLDAVQQGKGAMLTCTSLARDDIAEGRLVRPIDETVPIDETYWLLIPRSERHRPEVSGFRSWLLQEIAASFGRED